MHQITMDGTFLQDSNASLSQPVKSSKLGFHEVDVALLVALLTPLCGPAVATNTTLQITTSLST